MAGNPNIGAIKDEKDALSTFFKVVVPELRDITFKTCEGLESEIEVTYYPEAGRLGPPRAARGAQKANKLSFGQGTSPKNSGGKSVFDWYQDVCDPSKALAKKTVTIYATDSEGRTLAEWKVLNAWPCRWIAPLLSKELSSVSTEFVCFVHEGIQRVK